MISFKTDIDQETQITNEQSKPNENLDTSEDQFDHSEETSKNDTSDTPNETANLNEEHEANNNENDKTDKECNKENQNFKGQIEKINRFSGKW